MRMPLSRCIKGFVWIILFLNLMSSSVFSAELVGDAPIDRVQVVSHQIDLLKSRYSQLRKELKDLQGKHDEQYASLINEKASKNLQDKAALDISVAKSNLDSVNIELADSQQTVIWLSKNVQEIENQLNVMNIFGLKIPRQDSKSLNLLRADLSYQRKLLDLERIRSDYLRELQSAANDVFTLKSEHLAKLKENLKSRQTLYLKQKQVKDELAYQEDQNYWLQQLNLLYAKLAKVDPTIASGEYTSIERGIFYANEKASYAYIRSIIARYRDQIQQMNAAILRGNSISLLYEVSSQLQTLSKQTERLDDVARSRSNVLLKHVAYLESKSNNTETKKYVLKLKQLLADYKSVDQSLEHLDSEMAGFRSRLDRALQTELSARQGVPIFGMKSIVDIGKEMLLVPALTFQIIKSLGVHLYDGVTDASKLVWGAYIFAQAIILFAFFFLRKTLLYLTEHQPQNQERISAKWLALQYVQRNFYDIFILSNLFATFYYFSVPMQSYTFFIHLALVWLVFKAVVTVARLWLVESTHDSAGQDVQLYRRLRWIVFGAFIVITMTVFMHQLPLIYELKILADRLFLFSLMLFSLLLLKSWDVIPTMIISHMEPMHPYVEKIIRLIGIVVPLLLLINSAIGLLGYVNLVMTVTWYQGIFLLVMIGYLILRGLLSDGMMNLSGVMIRHTSNGWLWTEAFLKPLDKILRVALFMMAWVMLFLLYGWDKQSPMVERLTRMLHYQLANVLNTSITPLNIIELAVVGSIFYWTAKWTREFVYRAISSRTNDVGIRNSISILSQYSVVIIGILLGLRVLGIDLRALAIAASVLAFGIGLGLRDLANNFVCGFLILLERPLRVGDIVSINDSVGEVVSIGSRAITIRDWNRMEVLVPNAEIFHKSFTNWTSRDDIIRTVLNIKISRYDNPHEVKMIINNVLTSHQHILKEPQPDVVLIDLSDTTIEFEARYFINVRQVPSISGVKSMVLMTIWDEFLRHGIKPPYPQQEITIRNSQAGPVVSEPRVLTREI